MSELREADIRLLEAFSCALTSKSVGWTEMPDKKVWQTICHRAEEHKIFPMVMESISRSLFFVSGDEIKHSCHFYLKRSESEILTQARASASFLLLYEHLLEKGLKPLVIKGIICRSLYPEPEHRASCDEDLLIDPAEVCAYHRAMTEYGMEMADPGQDIEKADEITYISREKLLYIELHKNLFPSGSDVFSGWNRYITRPAADPFMIRVYGSELYTIDPTSHIIYLILHAFKHFLYGGFGIRLIADIYLFSKEYAGQISWERAGAALRGVHALDFAKAVYKIASRYLWKDDPKGSFPPGWDHSGIDEKPLLLDVMDSGVYGSSSYSRLHSSNMTLYAVQRSKTAGRTSTGALLHAVFLPRKNLEKKYPYLKKKPFLLPVAWTHRVCRYVFKTLKEQRRNRTAEKMTESMQLGKERIQLLRYYKVIE